MIEIRGVSKSYGSAEVVHNVTLDIPEGGITSIVGPNGAGKSTLLGMVARLLPMNAGSVSVDGLDVATGDSRELARRLAILRQDNHITIRLTVRDLIAFGRFPHSGGRLGPEDEAHVRQAMDYLDLADLGDRYLDQLSGGQRQRAFVAMVLAQDTKYVLLDEPLNNLDMMHSVAMMTLLRRLADELGKTVVIVIHDINFASVWSDRIVALKNGDLVRQGGVSEIMTPEALEEIFDLRFPIQTFGNDRVGLYYRAEQVQRPPLS